MENLTTRQERVLEAIKMFMAKYGYPPTVREIGNLINLRSSATIHAHITTLEEKGYLKKGIGKNRTIELLVPNEFKERNDGAISVPLLNKVKGNIVDAIEQSSEYIKIPANIIPTKKEVFALTMNTNSMIDAGILDKDIVIVEKKNAVNNRDIVVAITKENELIIETFDKENDTMKPVILDDVTILGKVIGLYRKY